MPTQLIRNFKSLKQDFKGCHITIGNFDGVHRGHLHLIEELKKRAKLQNAKTMVIIFEPQPLEFFAQGKGVARLSRFREKFLQLADTQVDYVLVVRFNKTFANLSPHDFIKKILYELLKIKHILVGKDFHFGAQRKGDLAFLQEQAYAYGFSVAIMEDFTIHNLRVSSTAVREALHVANHSLVQQLLGRNYCMMGRVVYGNQLGRQLGFPTANIYLHRKTTPILGIYVVRLHGIGKEGLPGVANVGIRPTIGGTRTLLEVYLFNFNQNIYGKYVTVEFYKKLRDEKRYDNLNLLKAQMVIDANEAKTYFAFHGEQI